MAGVSLAFYRYIYYLLVLKQLKQIRFTKHQLPQVTEIVFASLWIITDFVLINYKLYVSFTWTQLKRSQAILIFMYIISCFSKFFFIEIKFYETILQQLNIIVAQENLPETHTDYYLQQIKASKDKITKKKSSIFNYILCCLR